MKPTDNNYHTLARQQQTGAQLLDLEGAGGAEILVPDGLYLPYDSDALLVDTDALLVVGQPAVPAEPQANGVESSPTFILPEAADELAAANDLIAASELIAAGALITANELVAADKLIAAGELVTPEALAAVQDMQAASQVQELADARAQLREYEARSAELQYLLSEMQSQLASKNDILHWITSSRSWKLTGWVRRLNFLSLRLVPAIRHLNRISFHGALDAPVAGSRATNKLEIRGWVYSAVAPVASVEAFIDAISLGTLRYGSQRLAVTSFRKKIPVNCGYEGSFRVDPVFHGRRTLTVRVTDQRGHVKDYNREVEIVPSPDEQPRIEHLAISAGEEGRPPQSASLALTGLSGAKRLLTSMSRISLATFFSSNSTIEFPHHEKPATTILLVLYNRAELTLQCLYSILRGGGPSYEVVIVNNASTDETAELLRRVRGARVIENQTNLHYLRACNQGAREARGDYLLLLNNDAQLQGDGLSVAVETLNSSPDIGAVGGKVILPDGTLQEAGSVIWRDGSCLGYGRGDSPFEPAYMFRRDVDYCSAVFLLTRRALFLEEGGFDEAYAPAYYEETDYCVRLWKRGLRVVYDPRVAVVHYEFGSSASSQSAVELQIEHRAVFAGKHRDWLRGQQEPSKENVLKARSRRRPGSKRILFVEDRVPHQRHGSGFTRSNHIVNELARMGHAVTCYPTNFIHEEWQDVYRDLPQEVEVVTGRGRQQLQQFVTERADFYDIIFITRPHNLAAFNSFAEQARRLSKRLRVIYDAESLFTFREVGRLRLAGKHVSERRQDEMLRDEMELMRGCDAVAAVCERERRQLMAHGYERAHVLGHALAAEPTPKGFDERKDILFVGSVHEPKSPNVDSLEWFIRKCLPRVAERLGRGVRLVVAGHGTSEFLGDYDCDQIKVLGSVDDLTALYDDARLFVAPTRFAAGIPHKAHEAAARGIPVVATTLIGEQLGWRDGDDLLTADDPAAFAAACARLYTDRQLWERLRANALARIASDCSPAKFAERLRSLVE